MPVSLAPAHARVRFGWWVQIERHMQYIEKDADGFIPYETYLDKFIELDDRINNRIGFNPYINGPRSQEQYAARVAFAQSLRLGNCFCGVSQGKRRTLAFRSSSYFRQRLYIGRLVRKAEEPQVVH